MEKASMQSTDSSRSLRALSLAAALLLVGFVSVSRAQSGAAKPAVPAASVTTESATPASAVDPEAVAALERMGGYLRTLKLFQVESTTTDEDVLDSGEKIQYSGLTKFLVRFPANLLVRETNDRRDRVYVYDGTSFTLFAVRSGLYATVPAPPTFGELLTQLADKYELSVPLTDLFYWGRPDWTPAALTSATDVGPSDVDGTTCEQYAFRQDGLDWQIWIQKGDFPLPRRLVITTLTDEARPQHTASFTWNLAPSFNDATFAFEPPADAERVLLAADTLTTGSGN
jgi:hypothetical protein